MLTSDSSSDASSSSSSSDSDDSAVNSSCSCSSCEKAQQAKRCLSHTSVHYIPSVLVIVVCDMLFTGVPWRGVSEMNIRGSSYK